MTQYVGKYRPLRAIMTGQGSRIMEAMDDTAGKRCVLKWLLDDFRRDPVQIAAMKNEYAVGVALQHPRIIQVYELIDREGSPCLAMELFPSVNLKQRLRDVQAVGMAPQIESILHQAAEALAYMHSKGWIHKDIKPDNYLVNEAGEVKLIDFALAEKKKSGLARWFGGGSKAQGTVSYMSPEQIRGQVLDERADIYSFGCMAYELLSGKLPFVGSSPSEVLQKHLTGSLPALEAANPAVSPEISQLVGRMLAKKPESRPPSMLKVIEELRAIKLFRKPGKR